MNASLVGASRDYSNGFREIPEDKEDYARIQWLQRMHERYQEYWDPEIERYIRNARMMWGLNFGQWPAYVVEKLRSQGRRPPTLNIIGNKIEKQVGSFMSNGFDVGYAPVNGKVDSLSLMLTDMRLSDKHNLRWKVPERIALRDMFTTVGYERMVVSSKYSENGNISWAALNPTHIYLDTGWKDHDPDHIRNYFEWAMLDTDEIMALASQEKSERLKEIYEREQREGVNLGEFHGGVQRYKNVNDKWGDRHRVIAYHWVETDERYWEYDLKNRCMFPETGFKQDSPDDREAKIAYIQMMGLQPNEITKRKKIRREKRLEIIVPTIDTELFVYRGKDIIQTNNCNIYPLGNGYNGQFKGTADDLFDIQQEFNKGRMDISDARTRMAKGAYILDRALAGGDIQKEKEIEQQWNNPAARIWVDEGATADLGQHGGIIELKSGGLNGDIINDTERQLDYADWFSLTPAAMDARTQGGNESGKLYQTKYQVALIGQKYHMEIYEAHGSAKAAAYAIQAKYTYAGLPRTFTRAGGKESFEINRRVEQFTDTGERTRVTMDDISKLPDQLVNIVPSRGGVNVRNELQKQYGEILPLFNDPADRLGRLVFMDGMVQTWEMSEDIKEESKRAFQLLKQNEALRQAIENRKLTTKLKSMMAPPPALPSPGEQALPSQGGGVPGAEPPPPQQITPGEPTEEQTIEGTPQAVEFATLPGGS